MWLYIQRTGELLHDGKPFSVGYAGKYTGKNNPEMQHVPFTGPLPCGVYRIEDSYDHPHLGPLTMDLKPDAANEMFGRSLFRIHGINSQHPETSSDGCMCQPHEARVEIARLARTGDRLLEVVADHIPNQPEA